MLIPSPPAGNSVINVFPNPLKHHDLQTAGACNQGKRFNRLYFNYVVGAENSRKCFLSVSCYPSTNINEANRITHSKKNVLTQQRVPTGREFRMFFQTQCTAPIIMREGHVIRVKGLIDYTSTMLWGVFLLCEFCKNSGNMLLNDL